MCIQTDDRWYSYLFLCLDLAAFSPKVFFFSSFHIIYCADILLSFTVDTAYLHKCFSHFTGHFGATIWARVPALPLLLSEGTVALTMVSPLPRGDTSEWFVVGEDWWTAIATLFLCKINSTCRSVLYEWWRPPQAIHTAAQRQGSGPHRTYKAGIKQSLFSTGPCITHPHPHMNTQINQQSMHTDKHWLSVCGGINGNPIQSHSLPFKFNSEGFSRRAANLCHFVEDWSWRGIMGTKLSVCTLTLHRTVILDRPVTGYTPVRAIWWYWGIACSTHLKAE